MQFCGTVTLLATVTNSLYFVRVKKISAQHLSPQSSFMCCSILNVTHEKVLSLPLVAEKHIPLTVWFERFLRDEDRERVLITIFFSVLVLCNVTLLSSTSFKCF